MNGDRGAASMTAAVAPPAVLPAAEASAETISRTRLLWLTLRRKPLGAVSAAVILVIILTALLAGVLAPFDPLETRPDIRLQPPSREHLFGTDDIGRDVLSRIIYGSRISLWVGLLAVCLLYTSDAADE